MCRDAAERLAARGLGVRVFDAMACPPELPAADLVIDAAYGTGYRPDPDRPWQAPGIGSAAVLAVDVPKRHRRAYRDLPKRRAAR